MDNNIGTTSLKADDITRYDHNFVNMFSAIC